MEKQELKLFGEGKLRILFFDKNENYLLKFKFLKIEKSVINKKKKIGKQFQFLKKQMDNRHIHKLR